MLKKSIRNTLQAITITAARSNEIGGISTSFSQFNDEQFGHSQ